MALGLLVGDRLGLVLGEFVGSRFVTPTTDIFWKGMVSSMLSNRDLGLDTLLAASSS